MRPHVAVHSHPTPAPRSHRARRRGWTTGAVAVWVMGLTGLVAAPGVATTAAVPGHQAAARPQSTAAIAGELTGVTMQSASEGWSVGGSGSVQYGRTIFVQHWEGGSWSDVGCPLGQAADKATLADVAETGADDVWAVGTASYHGHPNSRLLIYHWDGQACTKVVTPKAGVGSVRLNAVSADAADDAWAVGSVRSTDGQDMRGFVDHWDGQTWTRVARPSWPDMWLALQDVTALGADDVWAVGWIENSFDGYTPYVTHWDGRHWLATTLSGPPDSKLFAMTVVSPDDIWAVGASGASDPYDVLVTPIASHWDGTTWTTTKLAVCHRFKDTYLLGVSASGAGDVWAVGDWSDAEQPHGGMCVEHWDGQNWSKVLDKGTKHHHSSGLFAVSAVSPNDVWAVGDRGVDVSRSPLYAHWDGSRWSFSGLG